MKKFVKIRGVKAWFEIFSRLLFIRKRKTLVETPVPDVLFNNSIYNYVLTWIYEQDYEVYLLHDTRCVRVGKNRFDDFRLLIDDLLNDYFDKADKLKGKKCSPMAMFQLYDYQNSPKNARKIAIIALDETQFACLNMNTKTYYDSYFGDYSR